MTTAVLKDNLCTGLQEAAGGGKSCNSQCYQDLYTIPSSARDTSVSHAISHCAGGGRQQLGPGPPNW